MMVDNVDKAYVSVDAAVSQILLGDLIWCRRRTEVVDQLDLARDVEIGTSCFRVNESTDNKVSRSCCQNLCWTCSVRIECKRRGMVGLNFRNGITLLQTENLAG